jgi:hypothetical protein
MVLSTPMRVFAVLLLLAACKSNKPEGLPPSQNWDQGSAIQAPPPGEDDTPHGGAPPIQPGMEAPNDQVHGGAAMPGPVDPNAAPPDDSVHGGMASPHGAGGGTDVTQLGLSAPDPSRPMDPTHYLRGVITIDPKLVAHATPGTAVFIMVRRPGADGNPGGPPLAVDKLEWKAPQLAFELSEAQAMVSGTELTGEVFVQARVDHDGDAMSKEPGDVVGQTRIKIPADGVTVKLDTLLP